MFPFAIESFSMISVFDSIILATRKSPLALAQADLTQLAIKKISPVCNVSQLKMTTTGDQRLAWSLEQKGGKGLFTKELEVALLEKRADIAVHSAKDLPTEMEPGLALCGFLPRENVADVLVKRVGIERIQHVATGSPRRRAQMKLFLPDLEFEEIRGNVETRLNKIKDGVADATVLAKAGLNRLGIFEWPGVVFEELNMNQMIPAVGQGAIALQCREEDVEKYKPLTDPETDLAVRIERTFLSMVEGGCQTAFAAHYCEGVLSAFHEKGGRFVLEFESLEQDVVESTIRKALEQFNQQ